MCRTTLNHRHAANWQTVTGILDNPVQCTLKVLVSIDNLSYGTRPPTVITNECCQKFYWFDFQDILHTQEQNLALQFELLNYKKTTDEQLQYLKVHTDRMFAASRNYQNIMKTLASLYAIDGEEQWRTQSFQNKKSNLVLLTAVFELWQCFSLFPWCHGYYI